MNHLLDIYKTIFEWTRIEPSRLWDFILAGYAYLTVLAFLEPTRARLWIKLVILVIVMPVLMAIVYRYLAYYYSSESVAYYYGRLGKPNLIYLGMYLVYKIVVKIRERYIRDRDWV